MSRRKKPDHYTQRAKKTGYPARSVYKLEEMDRKYHLVPRTGAVLDAGAAPGSWSLYVLRTFPSGKTAGRLSAIDLNPLKIDPDPRLTFFQGSIFSPEARQFMDCQGPFQLIMSDAAPSTTGNRLLDTARSAEMAEGILSLSGDYLAKGGNLVIKIFQGGEEEEVFQQLQRQFGKAKRFTPAAVRNESYETYLIGLDFQEEKP